MGHLGERTHGRPGLSRIEWLAVVFVLSLAGTMAVYLSPTGGGVAARRAACLANLSEIGQAMGGYMEASDDHWPAVAKLKSLAVHDPPWPMLPEVLKPYVEDAGVFRCPADSRTLAPDSPLAKRFPRRTTYFDTEERAMNGCSARPMREKRWGRS